MNMSLRPKQDHLFLVREGWDIRDSWKFKVMVLEPVFDTGSMAGLMTLFGRHSVIWTNFKIYLMESRPIGTRWGLAPREEAKVCGGPSGPGVPWLDACHRCLALVGPWQYQCNRLGSVPGIPLPGTTQPCTTPGTPTSTDVDQHGDADGYGDHWDMHI